MAASFRVAVAVTCALVLATACQGLQVGYYNKSCPRVEHIVRDEVKKFVYKNAGVGAGLIRMLFHDCFVQVMHNQPCTPWRCFFLRTMDSITRLTRNTHTCIGM